MTESHADIAPVNSMIDVIKSNVEADMGRKEQVTAYIEYAPTYRRKEICSRIFWKEEGEKAKREFIAKMINLVIDTKDNIIITRCPVNGETVNRDREITIYSWISEGVKK
tara:strand:- start:304 stop:633 length:330 start_codon:yes stop_codon:yes gene_type:complete